MRPCCSPKRLQVFSLFVAAVTIVTILIILFLFNYPSFAHRRIEESVVFKNGTIEMERFKTTADLVNLRLSIYVYNVTNVDEVVLSSAKVKFKEIGPFVYHEYKSKEILDYNQTTGLISFKLRKQYTFRRDLSIGDPKLMNVTWPNVPLIAARAYLDKLAFIPRTAAYFLFNQQIKAMKEPAFISDSVENFIFTGSKRYLFEKLQSYDIGNIFKPWPLKDNKFAVLYDRNNTWYPERDHVFTVSAGFGGNQTAKDLNQYIYMNRSAVMPYWHPQPAQCNKLEGTDGEFFSPFLNSSENLVAFSSDVCRKLTLKYRHNTVINGINVYKYTLDERSFQSGVKNPDNMCYCLMRDSNGNPSPDCSIDGLVDLSSCVAPNVFASGAHFLYGDPKLNSRIAGVEAANVSIDEPYAYVEPNTGLTIQVKVPLQLNVRLERGGFTLFDFFKDYDPLIMPLLSVVEAAELTEQQGALLRSKLLLLDSWLVSMVLGGAIVLVLAIIAASAVLCIRYRRRHVGGQGPNGAPTETDPLISPSSHEGSNQVSEVEESIRSNTRRSNTYQAV